MDAIAKAREVLDGLGIEESENPAPRPISGHHSSILVPCIGHDGRDFLLKLFIPPDEGKYYPPEVKIQDYARREIAFYSFLDSWDVERRELAAPKTIMMDHKDPPSWILLEYIHPSPGPASENLSSDNVFDLIARMHSLPMERLRGRRNFPLNRWDITSLRDRVVRLMYDPLFDVVGKERWAQVRSFYDEAVRWLETRELVPVHGDFTEDNILVEREGRPYLVDFERIGTGSPEHDFTWFWIHSRRSKEWKRDLYVRFLDGKYGSTCVRTQWGMRATAVYLACRRLRFGCVVHGDKDKYRKSNLALLEAALAGEADFFPA